MSDRRMHANTQGRGRSSRCFEPAVIPDLPIQWRHATSPGGGLKDVAIGDNTKSLSTARRSLLRLFQWWPVRAGLEIRDSPRWFARGMGGESWWRVSVRTRVGRSLQLYGHYEWLRRDGAPAALKERSRDGLFVSLTQYIHENWDLSASYAHAFKAPGGPVAFSPNNVTAYRLPLATSAVLQGNL